MMTDKLNDDMKAAMKSGDAVKLSVLRMLKADIMNKAISLKKNDLTDDEVQSAIQKQINQRKDSVEQFKNGNRPDLAEKEAGELVILESYLPAQLPDEELRGIVLKAICDAGEVTVKDMGRIIKVVMPLVKGRADGKRVSALITEQLSKKG